MSLADLTVTCTWLKIATLMCHCEHDWNSKVHLVLTCKDNVRPSLIVAVSMLNM